MKLAKRRMGKSKKREAERFFVSPLQLKAIKCCLRCQAIWLLLAETKGKLRRFVAA
jgi:hypothetical protein